MATEEDSSKYSDDRKVLKLHVVALFQRNYVMKWIERRH